MGYRKFKNKTISNIKDTEEIIKDVAKFVYHTAAFTVKTAILAGKLSVAAVKGSIKLGKLIKEKYTEYKKNKTKNYSSEKIQEKLHSALDHVNIDENDIDYDYVESKVKESFINNNKDIRPAFLKDKTKDTKKTEENIMDFHKDKDSQSKEKAKEPEKDEEYTKTVGNSRISVKMMDNGDIIKTTVMKLNNKEIVTKTPVSKKELFELVATQNNKIDKSFNKDEELISGNLLER